MKLIQIDKINSEEYSGYVYNVELKPTSDIDDLFWIEQRSGLITHNCIPKDVYGWASWAKSCGYTPKLTNNILKINNKLLTENILLNNTTA